MAGIMKVLAGTLDEAKEECGELADLLHEIRGALHRNLRAPEEDLREQVRESVRELDAMLAGDGKKALSAEESDQEQVCRVSQAIRVALPEVRDLLAQRRLEPTVARRVQAELVSFLEAFLPELRDCLPHPRD
jgi:ABC-type transporter Mla subunit MlaD